MWSYSRTRAFAAAVVAAALMSAGCLNPHLNPFPAYPPYQYPYPYPPYPPPPNPSQPAADKSVAPFVDHRTGDSVVRSQYQQPAATPPAATPPAATPPAESMPLPQPKPTPPAPPGTVPSTPPQVMPLPGHATANPHQKDEPSAVGGGLGLRRDEMPIDRAVEILQRLDALIEENKRLQTRIRTLEANALSREKALDETLREVEKATEEVVKARTEIQSLRAEVTNLRAKVKQVEENETDTLKKVIAALEKVLDDK